MSVKPKGRISFIILVSLVFSIFVPQSASAWTRSNHQTITTDAYTISTTFKDYIQSNGLEDDLLYYVDHADDTSEKNWVAWLDGDDSHSPAYNVDIWEKDANPDEVPHVKAPVQYDLTHDYRLHNSMALLDLALSFKSSNKTLAMRIFANGLHLMQDYFAHLNAPGGGGTHGVDVMVDTNGNGVPDTSAEDLIDDLNWDCHSDYGNELIPMSLRESDVFNASYWHRHANREDCWRYKAAKEMTIEYMQAYAVYESSTYYDAAVARGWVNNYDVDTYIDLLTRVIVDNTDASCTFDSIWPTSASTEGYYGTDYARDQTPGAARWAKWTPNIPIAGNYKVYMRWTEYSNRPTAAPLTIAYNGGTDTSKTVNQTANGNKWNLIGTYNFSAGSSGYVKIGATSGQTVADAVMFIRVT